MQVTFSRRYEPDAGWEDEDNVSPYISLENPEEDIQGQRFPDEVVIPLPKIRVRYDYPLETETILSFDADTPAGFTRAHLARQIAAGYHRIYQEEEAVVGNPGHIPGMMNRKRSRGPYGIWGHDLGDLVLAGATQVAASGKDSDLFELEVDS